MTLQTALRTLNLACFQLYQSNKITNDQSIDDAFPTDNSMVWHEAPGFLALSGKLDFNATVGKRLGGIGLCLDQKMRG